MVHLYCWLKLISGATILSCYEFNANVVIDWDTGPNKNEFQNDGYYLASSKSGFVDKPSTATAANLWRKHKLTSVGCLQRHSITVLFYPFTAFTVCDIYVI